MIWSRKALEELIERLERRINQLDERISSQLAAQAESGRRTDEQLADFREQQRAAAADIVQGQQQAAVEMVSEIRRLDGLVREGRADLAANSERFAKIVEFSEQSFALVNRLDANVVAGFAAVGNRLETDLVVLAEQSHQLGGRVSQLADFMQRHDNNTAEQFAGISKRLETDLALLAERSHQLGASVSQLTAAISGRLSLAGGVAPSDFVARLAADLDAFAALISRLDKDVATGFGAVGTRLETDLVTLARTTHELVESSRYAAGTLSKLVADQIQFAGEARRNDTVARSQPAPATATLDEPPVVPLEDAELPAAVRKSLAAYDIGPNQSAWCLNQKLLPQTPDALARLPEIMAACRRRLQPGQRIVWSQQMEQEPLLAPNELEQILGLIGSVQGPIEVRDKRRIWRVAVATRRVEAACVVLRWSIPALEALHVRLRPLADEMLERLALREAAHAVDLPEPDADMKNWARLLPSLVATVATQQGVPIGITLPTRFDEAPTTMDDAVARLRQALRDGGKKDEIALQWVRGSVRIDKSSAVLAFAHRHGIKFDLTPVSRGALDSRLAAYDDRLPYRALPFDLRLPSYAADKDAVIEIPRWAGRTLDTRIANGEPPGLGIVFDAEFEQYRRRLARVLDRAGQKQFELQANADATLVGYWPEYFVYNWSPPAGAWLRVFEFDASELFAAASPLNRVLRGGGIEPNGPHCLNGEQFLAASAKAAWPIADNQALKQLQIEVHRYLHDQRPDITGDAERLIDWMPQALGITLELGSGFGVMARRLQDRASCYIGFDLTFDQAAALRQRGGLGLVADMHALPFGDAVFDTIVADNVIEHAADPLQALLECRRVLKPGGQAFMAIPLDYRRSEFCNQAHLWKADEQSVREALVRAGFRVVRQETVHLADLGVGGAYPSSDGQTGLWQVEKAASATNTSPATSEPTRMQGANTFDLASSRAYWRYAPSGAGKHDTSLLLNLNATELGRNWDEAFNKRFLQYPEEDEFVRQMSDEFAGKRVLSIGSGLGLHEIYYQLHGARVTCCDIVASNLEVIKRVAAAKGAAGMQFVLSSGPDHGLEGPYDVIFIYGSLMTMPQALQRRLIDRCLSSLVPEGCIILMLYTWEFARLTCGWSSPDEFDAQAFARASDPSVGSEHCPWSDWHDADKLSQLVTGTMHITRRQLWNQGWFVWYELRRTPVAQPAPFFDPARVPAHASIDDIDLSELQPVDATSSLTGAGLAVETGRNSFGYALTSEPRERGAKSMAPNAVAVDVDLEQGELSVGLLDATKNTFGFAQAIWQRGRHQHVFAFDRINSQCKVVISNFRRNGPGISRFVLHRLALLQRPVLEAPAGPRSVAPVRLAFPSCLQEEHPQEFDAAWAVTNAVLDTLPGSDFTPLARHSPGLANFDWSSYVRLNAIRMVRVGAALREAGLQKGRILDFGSYFGNFALFARRLGFDVDAADQYTSYGKAFERMFPLLRSAGIRIIDLGRGATSDLGQIPESSYDAVLCLGVIEHVPHTPKPLLVALNRVLRPGGTLILDTPNLLYVHTRERLASGRPIAAPIQSQFDVEPPFEGHHREYTSEEVVWMLQQIGHHDIHVELFNYSVYFLSELHGEDADRFRRMERDPQLRELMMTRSKKPMPEKVNARTSSPRPQRPSPPGSGGRKRP